MIVDRGIVFKINNELNSILKNGRNSNLVNHFHLEYFNSSKNLIICRNKNAIILFIFDITCFILNY
jgi:hypothetical protein